MDKRTLLIVLSLTLLLFFVNNFFQQQHQDEMKDWYKKQKILKDERLHKLEYDVANRTAKPETLQLVEIFSAKDETLSLATGLANKDTLLTLSWSTDLPEKIYIKNGGEFTLAKAPKDINQPILYQKDKNAKLNATSLPHFGFFELQMAMLPGRSVMLAEMEDGHISFPALELQKLQNETASEKSTPEKPSNAIALYKTAQGYLPVAWYHDGIFTSLDEPESMGHLVNRIELEPKKDGEKAQEKFYVLENQFQQLVLSNYGGAIAEINLPFESKTDRESPVKPIDIDRQMVKDHPLNALFPIHPYYTPGEEMKLHDKGVLGGYYPLIRRDLIGSGQGKSVRIPPRFYAFNVVSSEFSEVADLVFEVKEFTPKKIVFQASQPHRRITKTFTLSDNTAPYCIDLNIQIEGDARNLWLSSGIPEVEWISGAPAPSLRLRLTRNDKGEVEELSLPSDAAKVGGIYPDWLSNSNGFFGIILDPLTEIDEGYLIHTISGKAAPSRLVEIDQEYQLYNAEKMPGYITYLPLSKRGGEINFRIFAGPYSTKILKEVDATYSDPSTNYNPDYIATQTFHGWFAFISEPFAKFLMILMTFFHAITHSWGLSIILLTVALRVMMYPLNAWSTKSMLKMQKIAPHVTKIQEKHKNDPRKMQLEVMNLYREAGANPFSGCFPILIQMPFLIGMFGLLRSTFELRGASFIPGWIDDLAAPDVLFTWKMPIWFIGNEFHLLPILLGGVMFIQQAFMSNLPKDVSQWTDQQRQQRAMGNIMAVVFAVLFYSFPSGLNIYWLFSMLLGILQQWWTSRSMSLKEALPVVEVIPKKVKK